MTWLLLALGCSWPALPNPAAGAPGGGEVRSPPPAPAGPSRGAGCPERSSELGPPSLVDPEDGRLLDDPLIVVFKGARRLGLYRAGSLEPGACWPVALAPAAPGQDLGGPKLRRGDRKTPEGWYLTADKPASAYYHALWLYYPNAEDARRGLAAGRITAAEHDAIVSAARRGALPPQDTALGGQLLIHGGGAIVDWTLGCVALADADIDALRERLPASLRVQALILP